MIETTDPLISEEIFGPLLPIVKADHRQACEIMQEMEHPLGLYIFSTNKNEIDESKQDSTPLISHLPMIWVKSPID